MKNIFEQYSKEMELILRLYFGRCDRKPFYWHWERDKSGIKIRVMHKGIWQTVTMSQIKNFFIAKKEHVEECLEMGIKG